MANNILAVDAGVAALVTLIGLAAHVVEHVLLGEADTTAGSVPLPLPVPACVHNLGLSVDSRACCQAGNSQRAPTVPVLLLALPSDQKGNKAQCVRTLP